MSENSTFFQFLAKNKLAVCQYTPIFLVIGAIIIFLSSWQYSATARVLVIHKINPNLDAYTAARAAEKLSANLVEVMSTGAFMDMVTTDNADYLPINWPSLEQERRNLWANKVEAKVQAGTSIIDITAYDANKALAEKLDFAVSNTLINRSAEFHGGGEDIVLKLIDKPLVASWPDRPNIILVMLSSLIAGLVFGYLKLLKKFNQKRKS